MVVELYVRITHVKIVCMHDGCGFIRSYTVLCQTAALQDKNNVQGKHRAFYNRNETATTTEALTLKMAELCGTGTCMKQAFIAKQNIDKYNSHTTQPSNMLKTQ